ncbi:hypothetical protein EDD15DRAFT_2190469 [Pisolithus albus]|nr:hypothetical protein EDD15DRAFT_2190469 [Pisolithus albus]
MPLAVAPVQAVSSNFDTLQSPTPTESSWYLVGSNESLSSSQDKLFSRGSHNMKLDKSVVQRRIDMMVAEVVVSMWTQWHSHPNTMQWWFCTGVMWPQDLATLTFSRNHVRVWGQIWCGKYGFEHEGESRPHVRYFEPHGVLVVDAHILWSHCYAFHVPDPTTDCDLSQEHASILPHHV